LIADIRARDALPLSLFLRDLNPPSLMRVPGTSIFMTRDLNQVPVVLLHALKHYKTLHGRVVLMQVKTEDVPHVPDERRLELKEVKDFIRCSYVMALWMSQMSCARLPNAGWSTSTSI
jgi:K+ transporter